MLIFIFLLISTTLNNVGASEPARQMCKTRTKNARHEQKMRTIKKPNTKAESHQTPFLEKVF